MELGQIVLSKCGRDKKKYFFVVLVDKSKEYVFIADGDLRKIEKPKKKKLKHLVPLYMDETVKEKLQIGSKITNAELKKHIKIYLESTEQG
ncbi:MAG: RNA-binding protein [Ignavibacteriales bacterium]